MIERTHQSAQKARGRPSGAERTRETLVRAGLRLFGHKGFEATSTREIAAEAGANIGSIAYHFGGKEGLRNACADYIVETISGIAQVALDDAAAPDAGPASPEAAATVLRQVVEAMVRFIVQRPEAEDVAQFVMRELSQPTAALDTIYAGVFEPVHKRLCALWEAATGEPAESERTRITVFTLIGQVIYFRIAREAVRRRMEWRDIGQREAAAIVEVALGNLSTIINARRRGTS
ncbi:CerR family C-terminal domain-containing protein [Nitratireductor sp. GCM10026969]|uniref:CerR family C-terminal domain-containing protein n=1 Tax=Nitratireductor sp. GCM10026969 TaxID=3252645 RepID=UPI00360959A0